MNISSIGNATMPQLVSSPPAAGDAAPNRAEAPRRTTPQSPVQDKPSTPRPGEEKPLQEAVDKVKEYIQPFNNGLEFSINKDTDQLVVKVIDQSTKEVIRQIPSEEMQAIAKALDSLKGLLVRQTA